MKHAKHIALASAVAMGLSFTSAAAFAGNCWTHSKTDGSAETATPKPKTTTKEQKPKGQTPANSEHILGLDAEEMPRGGDPGCPYSK